VIQVRSYIWIAPRLQRRCTSLTRRECFGDQEEQRSWQAVCSQCCLPCRGFTSFGARGATREQRVPGGTFTLALPPQASHC
jgi:hypothetical protein